MSKQIKPLRATATALAALLLLAVTLNSCTKDPTEGELPSPDGESIAVHITFPKSEQPQVANAVAKSNTFTKAKARVPGNASSDAEGLTFWTSDSPNSTTRATNPATDPGTEAERQIDHMTILVFNADGTTLENVLDIDLTSANTSLPDQQPQWKDNKTLMVRPITDKTNPKKIYAVANWNETNFDKATYTEAMLKDALSTITKVEQLATPLLMSGSKSVNLSTSDSKVTIALERQVAKLNINLTVDAAIQAALPNIEWLTSQAQIMVGNIPDKSYVVGRTPAAFPAGYTLLTSKFIPMTAVSASGDLKWNSGIYVHENPLKGSTSKEKATWLVINLPYRNRSTGIEQYENYYQLYLDNTGNANPYQVLRNTIYNSNLKVMGLGQPFTDLIPDVNIEEELMVNPWEDSDLGIGNKPKYFKISRNRVVFQMTETHNVTILTDVSNWKFVNTNGETLFSYAENKTVPFTDANLTYTISGNVSAAKITITRNSDESLVQQKMTFVAQNIRVPLTVVEDNGIIPNSVLAKPVTSRDVFYPGWPNDKLPPRGLQLAKRGNKLPTDNNVALQDHEELWSIKVAETFETYATGLICSTGKSNTEKLIELGIQAYPFISPCVALGEGWYIPSRDELVKIFCNLDLLGSSYTYTRSYGYDYWSSSQDPSNPIRAWKIIFQYGGTDSYEKYLFGFVRCVKNI